MDLTGLLCAIAGIMLVAQLRAGSTQCGTALGMLVIVVLYKALIYLGLQAYYQTLAKGLVLLAVVIFDSFMTRRRVA